MTEPASEFHVPVRRLAVLGVPAAFVGVLCALLLWGLSALAGVVERLLWQSLPDGLGVARDTPLLVIGLLALAGLSTGLVIRYAPGHAGPDPATTELVSAPLPLGALPGLAVALVITLAGGVSLGPENPIMAINAGLVVALGMRFVRGVNAPQWLLISTAGTIGAMFGTPLAAALMFSELDPGDRRIPLWDRLFPALVSATTGALFMTKVADLDMAIDLPDYTWHGIGDLAWVSLVALVAAALGIAGAYVFDPLHRLLHRIGNPVVLLTLAGAVLGVLGVVGGTVTLFKGLDQMRELPGMVATTSAAGFLGLALVKLVAMLVASASGFRGGRIFPVVFVGAALGFAAHGFFPDLPVALAVAGATAGIVVAVTRSGWMSIFLVVVVVPDLDILVPVLFATLVAWLLVTNRPELLAKPVEVGGPHEPADGAGVDGTRVPDDGDADDREGQREQPADVREDGTQDAELADPAGHHDR
ncbi:ion channel protein [Cellulomonas sp. HZM]|uniref:ion channel protein n=1 Tax=Cellulomonas sp. HZM TaxID=1454010 RepID=UPI0009DDCD16|nr:ion channel protein [Cellulomonas sp. HZM]